jgi:hypothetical protein
MDPSTQADLMFHQTFETRQYGEPETDPSDEDKSRQGC